MAATCAALRGWCATAWRVSTRLVGPERRSTAAVQAASVSTSSQGRHSSMFGISRSEATCSTGWWVGPSSPRPIESWVSTKMLGTFISAAMRRALRA